MRIVFVFVILGLSACSSDPNEPAEYVGCATDENWRTFDEREPGATMEPMNVPTLTAPASGAQLPASPKPKLTWNQDPNDPGKPEGDVPGAACATNLGGLTALHEAPISGNVYDLQFQVGGKAFYRALTTLQ